MLSLLCDQSRLMFRIVILNVPCDDSAGTRGWWDTWEPNAGTDALSLIHGDE